MLLASRVRCCICFIRKERTRFTIISVCLFLCRDSLYIMCLKNIISCGTLLWHVPNIIKPTMYQSKYYGSVQAPDTLPMLLLLLYRPMSVCLSVCVPAAHTQHSPSLSGRSHRFSGGRKIGRPNPGATGGKVPGGEARSVP